MLSGCIPTYQCYVANDSDEVIYVVTTPSIESLYDERSIYYDSLMKLKYKSEGGSTIYYLKPHSMFRIYGSRGFQPVLEHVPFEYLAIVNSNDSLVFDGKAKILSALVRDKRANRYFIRQK